MMTVRVGIIGVGCMGTAHARCIAADEIKGMTLTAVCDTAKAAREAATVFCPGIFLYERYDELIQSGVVDAVIIATPHKLHADIAVFALKHGLHVMTEKPVDITVSKARILNETAQKSGKVFGIMFNQRTDERFSRAREILQSGQLGSLKRTVWIITNWYRTQSYYESSDWRATWDGEGGGVLINQAPHNLDLWQWICGMPVSVAAWCDEGKYHDIQVEDDATIFARFENGATGTFITTTGEYPGTNRLEIAGTLGKLVIENGVLKHWRLKEKEDEIRFSANESAPEIAIEYTEFVPEWASAAHAVILQNFANAVLKGEKLLAPGAEGINQLMITNAAYLSSWRGGQMVEIPFDEALFDKLLTEHAKESPHGSHTTVQNTGDGYSDRWQIKW